MKQVRFEDIYKISFKYLAYPTQLQLAKYFHTYFIFQKIISNLQAAIQDLQKNYLD
jgi:hypothetical protein